MSRWRRRIQAQAESDDNAMGRLRTRIRAQEESDDDSMPPCQ